MFPIALFVKAGDWKTTFLPIVGGWLSQGSTFKELKTPQAIKKESGRSSQTSPTHLQVTESKGQIRIDQHRLKALLVFLKNYERNISASMCIRHQ